MYKKINDYFSLLESLGRSPKTIVSYKERLKGFRRYLKDKKVSKLSDISLRHLQGCHDLLIKHGLKPASRLAYISTVQSFLKWAYEHKLILSNLAENTETPKHVKPLPPSPLTEEDITGIFESITTATIAGKRNKAIMQVFYATGIRKAELIGLNIGDIDFTTQTVFIRGKGGKDRIVPIHEGALRAISGYLAARTGKPNKKSPLFAKVESNGRIDANLINSIFHKLKHKSKKHIHPHLLRHTFACHMLKGGADIRYVQALLGHELPDTTSRYLGLVKEDLKREYDMVMEKIM